MYAISGISGEGRGELARVTGRGRRFVRASDVTEALGIDRRTATRKLDLWSGNGWLRRVRRDLYIPVPVDADDARNWTEDPLVVADEVWSPCYFTGWTAANHWSLTDQVFRTTVLKTTKRIRSMHTSALGQQYLLAHTTDDALTWGLETVWVAERRLLIASPARTVAEILDNPKLAGGIRHGAEILLTYIREHDPWLLVDAGDRLGNRSVFKRLGYLLSEAGVKPEIVNACAARVSAGFSLLEPGSPARGPYARAWNLRVNVATNSGGGG